MLGRSLKIVFCSLDKTKAEFDNYYASMPWYAVDFQVAVGQQRTQNLMQQLQLRGVPSVVFYHKNGKIETDGRNKILEPTFLANYPIGLDLRFYKTLVGVKFEPGFHVKHDNSVYLGDIFPEGGKEIAGRSGGNGEQCTKSNAAPVVDPLRVEVVLPNSDDDAAAGLSIDDNILEIEVEEGFEVFQFQLFSITGIEPEKQRIFIGTSAVQCCTPEMKAKMDAKANGGSGKGPNDSSGSSPSHPSKLPRTDALYWRKLIPGTLEAKDFRQTLQVLNAVKKKSWNAEGFLPRVYVLGNFVDEDPFCFGMMVEENPSVVQVRQQYLQQAVASLNVAPQQFQRFVGDCRKVRGYEQPSLQRACLSCIPIPLIYERAREGMKGENNKGTSTSSANNLLPQWDREFLGKLAQWFKKDFFRWPAGKPRSVHASDEGVKCSNQGGEAANESEQIFGAGNTEKYKCDRTQQLQRFPRYNNVLKLLETRLGRCGEWANCFTAMLRAVGFEARHVVDHTDHVWSEILLKKTGQSTAAGGQESTTASSSSSSYHWVHTDSCECAIDSPLVYEQGWGKKLTYCIAYGRDHCVDVTRRYTRKRIGELTRTSLPPEPVLKNVHIMLRNYLEDEDVAIAQLQKMKAKSIRDANHKEILAVRAERSKLLEKRREAEEKELAEMWDKYNADGFLKNLDAKNLNVRESGDQEWRRTRGELGNKSFGGSHGDTKSFDDAQPADGAKIWKIWVWEGVEEGGFVHGIRDV